MLGYNAIMYIKICCFRKQYEDVDFGIASCGLCGGVRGCCM